MIVNTSAAIASGQSLSAAVVVNGDALVEIQMPATWTTANLTFQTSPDGTTFQDLYDEEGTEVTVTAAASRNIKLNGAEWANIEWLKVRSGTTGTAVNQGGARTIGLSIRTI